MEITLYKRLNAVTLAENARLAAKLTGWKIDIKPESYLETLPKGDESAAQEEAQDVIAQETPETQEPVGEE